MKKILFAIPILFSSQAVSAHEIKLSCGTQDNMEYCYENHGPQGKDRLLVKGPRGVEHIRVVCNENFSGENTWTAYGANSQEFVEKIVSMWCN